MRVSFNVSEKIAKRLDEEAEKLGTSRGAMITTWIGEKLRTLDAVEQAIQQLTNPDVLNVVMKHAMEAKFNTETAESERSEQTELDL